MPNRVREVRKAKGWTIERLSDESGIAHGYLSEVERGLKVPGVVNAQKIARALESDVDYLFPLAADAAV